MVKKVLALLLVSSLLAALLGGCALTQQPVNPPPDFMLQPDPGSGRPEDHSGKVDLILPESESGFAVTDVRSSGSSIGSDETFLDLNCVSDSVTIAEAGTYRLSGTLTGQIVIRAENDEKVRLILDGAEICCEGHAAIYAVCADKVVITLAEGSSNLVKSVGNFVQTDENKVDAAVFAKCDLTFSGTGALGVSCEAGHGLVSKDDLKLKSGVISIRAAKQGIAGKDSVTLEGALVSIVCGTDGIRAEHDDSQKGKVEILGGELSVRSGTDGVDASGCVLVENGILNILSGSKDNSESGKGLKSDADITVSGGELTVCSYDDALHANGCISVCGGILRLASEDDGIHAEEALVINDGLITVSQSKEGLEAHQITINGGTISVTAADDGLNAVGDSALGDHRGQGRDDPFAADSSSVLTINGGTLTVNANGDGLDSNGLLLVTGGTVYISGPINGGNGAIDYGTAARISGGTFIAAGSAGMAETFGEESTQGSILLNVSNQKAGATVTLTDEDGTLLVSFSPEKVYQTVVVSAPGMAVGRSYTVSAGSFSQTVTLDSIAFGGRSGFGRTPGGMPPGGGDPGGGPEGGSPGSTGDRGEPRGRR